MARRKQQAAYTVDQIRELRETLRRHDAGLVDKIRRLVDLPGFDNAATLRNAAEHLTTTRMVLETVLDDCEEIAGFRGEKLGIPHLEDCGLEEQAARSPGSRLPN